MKIRNVSLVRPDDEGYRAHQGRHAQASMHLRDTLDPGPVHNLAGPIEELFRQWLTRRLDLTPRRILRYERLTREGDYKTYYKEIDAVEGTSAAGDSDEAFRPDPKASVSKRIFAGLHRSAKSTYATATGMR